jgi:hypothetical protein
MDNNITENQDHTPEEAGAAEAAQPQAGIAAPSSHQEAGGAAVAAETTVSPPDGPSPQPGAEEHYGKRVRDLQSQNDKLRHQLSRYEQLREEQSQTLLALKEALIRANPLVPAELLDTGSLAGLKDSFRNAEQVVGRVRERLEEDLQSSGRKWRIPAGSPVRSGIDMESLSPGRKIRHGLAQKMGQ